MPDRANPDLKILIARKELKRFMDQLSAVSPIPLSVMDNHGIIVYENGLVKDGNKAIQPTDNSHLHPIKVNDFQIGVVAGHDSTRVSGEELTESLRRAGEMLTTRLAYELKVDNLASEVVNSYQELNLFYEIGDSLSSVLDVETICHVVLEQAVDVIIPKRAFMMILDAEKEELVVVESLDIDKHLKGLRIRIEDSIYESVVKDREPLVIKDVEKYPHLKGKIARESIMSAIPLICVPISAKSEVFGVIGMSEKQSGEPFTSVETKLLCAMASQAGMSLGNARLYEDLRRMFLNTVEALAAAVEIKDHHMHGHCRRVAEYSVSIGEEIGLPGKEINDLELAGILHDIGKIGISESILRKSGELTERELAEIKSHPVKGAEIMEHIKQMSNIALWIRHHHERYDGEGYPDGLKGQEIPLHSRILAVADAYDIMTTDRNYHSAHPYDAAVVMLQMGSRSQFDPEIVDVLLSIVREDAYEKYMETYQSRDHSATDMLTRLAHYRVDNEISSILTREALGNELSELERRKLKNLRESVLR